MSESGFPKIRFRVPDLSLVCLLRKILAWPGNWFLPQFFSNGHNNLYKRFRIFLMLFLLYIWNWKFLLRLTYIHYECKIIRIFIWSIGISYITHVLENFWISGQLTRFPPKNRPTGSSQLLPFVILISRNILQAFHSIFL